MADIKQIMTQGANVERVDNPFVVSTSRALTKSELRAKGVDVDTIAKYANLPETAHVFCTFSGDLQLNVCMLSLKVYLLDANDNILTEEFNVDITKASVSDVIEEISSKLENNALVEFHVELRNNRIQITARRAQADVRVSELHVLDSRGNANAESVNDLSNPERLFTYFWPDARGISRRGDVAPTPARQEYVTSQSIGIAQGEPRTSASLNRGLVKHSSIIDKTSLLTGVNAAKPRKVRIPLEVTRDPIDFTVTYSPDTVSPPRAVWSSTSFTDPGAGGGNPIFGIDPSPRRGGISVELPHTVSVLALRGISVPPKNLPFNTARIVNAEGTPLGLVSPDSRIRGSSDSVLDKTELDYGVPFITESSRWRVVKSDVEIDDHVISIINPSPLSKYLAFPEDRPLIDEGQFEILGQENEFETGFTRIDDVTLELAVPINYRLKWARVRLSGSENSFIVREWINERRIIISEIPDALKNSGYYVSAADLDDLDDPAIGSVFISRGVLTDREEWFYLSVFGTGGPLEWASEENLYLEIDVADPPASVNGDSKIIMDVKSSIDLSINNSVVRGISPNARTPQDAGAYTLKGAHESVLGGMPLRHSLGTPYDTEVFNELLTRSNARLLNGPHTRPVSDSLGGVTFQQMSESSPTFVFEQVGLNVTVDLSDAVTFYNGDEYADGIDQFLYDKFRVTEGDVRYRVLRALTLRYAKGTLGRNLTIHPETFSLTLEDLELATDLMQGVGFIDEHIGLSILVTDYAATPILITITSVETKLSARFKYLDISNVFSGMTSEVVALKLAPHHLISDLFSRDELPSITLEGLDTVGGRVDGPASIEIKGARPLESYVSLGDWMNLVVQDNRTTFPIYEYGGIKYAQVPLTSDPAPVSYADLNSRLKVRDATDITSLGGKHWASVGLTHPGEFPDFILIGPSPKNAINHAVDFYYKVSAQGSSSGLVYPPFKVESRDVIVVKQDQGVENYAYGLMIPVPDHALTTSRIRQQDRTVLISGSIEILKKKVSINKDSAYIDSAYLDKPSVLNELNVYASRETITPRLEISVNQDYHEDTPRPNGLVESRSEHISDFDGMRASARVEARHEYQERSSADNDAVVVSEMSLSGGPIGTGLTANHRYDQESDEYQTLVTVYGGDVSASIMKDGLYVTDSESRCEDVPTEEMTGFDHRHLSGDVAVNTANVKKLSEELDSMKQREFGVLRQLSLLSASAHEALDMLRTANATIRSLRDVQYELSMALLMTMDNARASADSNRTVRTELIERAGGNVSLNTPHRLNKALHLAGHAVMTGLEYSRIATQENLEDYFLQSGHLSDNADSFEDCVPLKYDRPGYARVRTTALTDIDQYEALDPLSDNLKPTTLLSTNAYYPLYVTATHKDRESTSRENVSWTSALNETKAIIQEARDKATSDFSGLVSYASPVYSFRPRRDFTVADDMANDAVCVYLMGVGYWSPTSIGHTRERAYIEKKARPDASGWFFTTTSTRRVGPEQVSVTDNMMEYARADDFTYNLGAGQGDRTLKGYGTPSRAMSLTGNNDSLYDDDYIISQVEEGKDLIVGVAMSPTTGDSWQIRRASLLGYPFLFQRATFVAPASETRVYNGFEAAKNGSDLFYCIETEEGSPIPIIPGLHTEDPGSLSSNLPITMPNTYGNDLMVDLYGPIPDALDNFKVVYCRAWCVVRGGSEDELWNRLQAEGYTRDDKRVNAKLLSDGVWAGIRTRLGMADFIKNFNYGHYAGPGQVRFSFNESLSGTYATSNRQVKTSQDPT